jgi:hypothetical protein
VISCLIEPHFAALVTDNERVLRGLRGCFDVVGAVDWEPLGPRLNVAYGHGKTRVIESLKRFGRPITLMPPTPPLPADWAKMSGGMIIAKIAAILCEITPPDACLVLDDVLAAQDPEQRLLLLDRLLVAQFQTILTVDDHDLVFVKAICGSRATYTNVENWAGDRDR